MMLGYREKFEYFQCSNCECLQIAKIPVNLEKYYPSDYYTYSRPNIPVTGNLKRFLRRQRTIYYLNGKGFIGWMMTKIFGKPSLHWIKQAGFHLDSRILDVGCGAGHLLMHLRKEGFSNLTGIDPFLEEDCDYGNGVVIFKKALSDLGGSFEFVMLHHSFEHVPDPIETLEMLREKTEDHGTVLIRIPIVSSFAWREYRTNWVQLDAPRHIFLHSLKSMEMISRKTGFEIESIEYDSGAFQFWGSEQYKKDIPLHDECSYKNGLEGSIFKESDIRLFQGKAEDLNSSKDGDQACFYLKKSR